MKFIVDENLGKLAKWLRLAGYDTLFFTNIEDAALVEYATREKRTLVTRDRNIARDWTIQDIIIVESDNPYKQLEEVTGKLHLELTKNSFSRCVVCNTLLEPIDKKDVKERVPPFVYEIQKKFSYCKTCDKVYWKGTHFTSLNKRLTNIQNAIQGNT